MDTLTHGSSRTSLKPKSPYQKSRPIAMIDTGPWKAVIVTRKLLWQSALTKKSCKSLIWNQIRQTVTHCDVKVCHCDARIVDEASSGKLFKISYWVSSNRCIKIYTDWYYTTNQTLFFWVGFTGDTFCITRKTIQTDMCIFCYLNCLPPPLGSKKCRLSSLGNMVAAPGRKTLALSHTMATLAIWWPQSGRTRPRPGHTTATPWPHPGHAMSTQGPRYGRMPAIPFDIWRTSCKFKVPDNQTGVVIWDHT